MSRTHSNPGEKTDRVLMSLGNDSDQARNATQDGTNLAWIDLREKRNPHHWSFPRRLFHTAIPCLLAFQVTFGTSVTVPATQAIGAHFDVSRTASILVITVYTVGVAFGPLFFAPLSEIAGRRRLYVVTTFFLLAFTAGAGASYNFSTLLVCRFLAAFLGSAGVAVGAGTVVDVWGVGRKSGIAGMLFILGPFLGPALGPLAGAYIMHDRGGDWRWTQWLLCCVGTPVWIGSLVMGETSKDQILRNAEKKEKKKTAGPLNAPSQNRLSRARDVVGFSILRAAKMLFSEPIVFFLTVYSAYAYAMIFSYFGSTAYVLQLKYGFNSRQVGLSLISVIIGFFLGSALFATFDKTLYARATAASPQGMAAPEHRLYSAIVGSCFLPLSLFWYAWEAHSGGHWAALVAAGIPFGFGALSLFLSTITYLVDVYGPRGAASALSANGTLRYTLGATFPLFTVQMYEKLGVHWAGSLYAFLSLALMPIPWLLFRTCVGRGIFFDDVIVSPWAAAILEHTLDPTLEVRLYSANTALRAEARRPVHIGLSHGYTHAPFWFFVNINLMSISLENGAIEFWLGTHNDPKLWLVMIHGHGEVGQSPDITLEKKAARGESIGTAN
ncbi:hypothetical protein PV08_10024 [Exophiala spinifera]|uniref:Major facilitator superfamily (MFS) profile domain-containing protein n=1 Tax=Exophiala spinifera TaxID=91928 RepID=A0A0D2AW62_9EURO|nr:uncharacterized protein PV08_10024 [Exophiala spinifera]KIW10725.1 hypothetical protein PV08_10024 [Exophiala spinifera]